MITGELVKASIVNLDSGAKVDCLFNPGEYTFSKSNNWTTSSSQGENVPKMKFSGGNPADLKMQLFFDTYESGDDVREKYTNELWKLAMVNKDKQDARTRKGQPPMCEFRWGRSWSFKAVVASISQKFTLFLADGTPVRSVVDITFRQVEDEGIYPRQNPTSGGSPGYRTHIVREGEKLDWIAAQEYGNPNYWRWLADVNKIDNPLRVQAGTVLSLPPLP